MANRQKLFAPDVMLRYPKGTPAENLRHSYMPVRQGKHGRPIRFNDVHSMLEGVKRDVKAWYGVFSDKPFDNYHLGDMIQQVRMRFWTDPRFKDAFDRLGLDCADIEKVALPWWNEIAANEFAHKIEAGEPHVVIGPRHSFETQLVRRGVEMSVRSVSVEGIIETSDGFIVIGLRGGATFPNTYHLITAGALNLSAGIIGGTSTIYRTYSESELPEELGVTVADVASATILSRIMDYAVEMGPAYVFHVKMRLTLEELQKKFEANSAVDKAEHQCLVSMPANENGIMGFLQDHYKGLVANRQDRPDSERVLHHSGALALLSFTGLPVSELERMFREGVW